MAWLVSDDKVLAAIEVAGSRRDRTRGLLGRDALEGAILLRPARSIHTFGMRFPIDVAFIDREGTVLRLTTVRPNRLPRPVFMARAVIETEAGAFGRWGVRLGDRLEVRGEHGSGR